jgi:hypothetical protein
MAVIFHSKSWVPIHSERLCLNLCLLLVLFEFSLNCSIMAVEFS